MYRSQQHGKAIAICPTSQYIIGGGEYNLGISFSDKIELTRVIIMTLKQMLFPRNKS
jgi:hypothetical protein